MGKKKAKKPKKETSKKEIQPSLESLKNQGIAEVDFKKMMGCGG